MSYFRDLDLFWELQNSAIADKAESLKAEGWEDVQVLEVGDAFHPYGYVRTGRDKGGHVYISVAHNGVVEIYKGYLSRKEVEAIEKAAERAAKKAANDSKPDNGTPQPAMTQTLENYLHLHRHAVVCAEPTRDGGWTGPIFLLGQHVKVKLAPNDNQANPKAPAFRILAGAAELGALWQHKTRDEKPQDYLSGEADFPGLAAPISLAVFFAEDGRSARVVWSGKA